MLPPVTQSTKYNTFYSIDRDVTCISDDDHRGIDRPGKTFAEWGGGAVCGLPPLDKMCPIFNNEDSCCCSPYVILKTAFMFTLKKILLLVLDKEKKLSTDLMRR